MKQLIYLNTELDQTINDLYEMPNDVGADRKSIQDNWTPFKLPTN